MLKEKEILEFFEMLGLLTEEDRKRVASLGAKDIAEIPEGIGDEEIVAGQFEIVADSVTSSGTDEGGENARLERSAG